MSRAEGVFLPEGATGVTRMTDTGTFAGANLPTLTDRSSRCCM